MAASKVRSTYLVFALAGIIGLCALAANAQQTVLFIGGSTTPSTTDANVMSRIVTLGHTTSYVEDTDSAGYAAALPSANMILVSSTAGSGDAVVTMGGSTAVRDLNKPLMCYEDYLYDDMQTLPSYGNGTGVQILISTPLHPLAAGLVGTVTVYTSALRINTGSALSGAGLGAVPIATINAGADAPILFYDTGDALVDGTLAPAPRLNYFLHDVTFDSLTPDGLKLFDAAINHMIPEPASLALLAIGGLALIRRRRR